MTTPASTDPRDVFALFLGAHARIEAELVQLDRAARALAGADRSVDAAAADTVRAVLEFFAGPGARHQVDEELSLFPRLRPLPSFAQMLGAFDMQHRMNDDAQRDLTRQLARGTAGGAGSLASLAGRFAELNRAHMIAEERALFPLAARALSAEETAKMVREIEARERG